MPLFQNLLAIAGSDWFKALMFLGFGPVLPLLLVLSIINQIVRVKRKLYGDGLPSNEYGECVVDYQPRPLGPVEHFTLHCQPAKLRMTLRVHIFVKKAAEWDWVSILSKAYILAIAFAIYSVAPLSIEILLGWFSDILKDFPLHLIIVAVWIVGLVLFLLPPVPGAPVYLFGGILITRKASEEELLGSDETGFWFGAAISIFVCWVLKLSACAMQQKGIGGLLGTQLWVRQTCGVHKPTIRAIEMILRKPGLSFGKVMILCGGPDWPTSVLCGLLKLSLCSCEVGTTPIIFYIAPFSLSGSFYLRRSRGEIWENASNMMLLITIVMTVVYWAACAWVIQHTFSEHHDELSRKLASNIDLDWLDYREKLIMERTVVNLRDAPDIIKVLYVGGAVILVSTVHAFQWAFSYLFGTFSLSDNVISEIEWFHGDDSIIKTPGIAVIIALFAGILGKISFDLWKAKSTKDARMLAMREAASLESAWKEIELQRRLLAEEAAAKNNVAEVVVMPVAVENEKDDPEKTPETYVPVAEGRKDVSPKGASGSGKVPPMQTAPAAQSAIKYSVSKARMPKVDTE
jgi:hypothetical protein